MTREELQDSYGIEVKDCYGELHDYIKWLEDKLLSLPPADATAEEILERGLRNGKYEDITCNPDIEIKAPFYQAIIRYAEDVAAQRQPQPTEGAEEDAKLTQEISTWKYLADGLTQSHQQNIKAEILVKVRNMETLRAEHVKANAALTADKIVSERLRELTPSNEKINEAAKFWAKEHSEAPDKDCPDWLIRDYEAGAYFVRQCMGCWNKTDNLKSREK